ncbi:MAG: cation:proton antiporter domain-containing protein [Alphaproteobacteria bacterium]
MHSQVEFAFLQQVLIVLGAVCLVIPVFHRLKLSPVFGFILIGMILGPSAAGALVGEIPGLGWIALSDRAGMQAVAEFGVVFVMFMIGLELSFERLILMRRLVFGLGPLQVVLSAAAIALVAFALGESRDASIVIGLALSLSSTAICVHILSEEKRLMTGTGRTSFSVLLFQDIAVIPILFAVSIMGLAGATPDGQSILGFVYSLGQAVLAVVAIIAAGRLLLRPLFRSVARTRSPELFMAACLLVVLGGAAAAEAAGFSMAMGALLAGLLLAETEYRRQIEVLIEPFKGLLLGVFLISMGMTLNLAAIAAAPLLVAGLAAALILGKAALAYLPARLFDVPARSALQSSLLLGPAGEFSFVVLSAAAAFGLLGKGTGEIALIVTAVTMALTPFLSALGKFLSGKLESKEAIEPSLLVPDGLFEAPRVIVVGYGRVGQVVASLLTAHGIDYVAVDYDADVAAQARAAGAPVFYGDATNPMILQNFGLASARALVVTMDSPTGAEEVVAVARKARSALPIVVRARDARHAGRLYERGASNAVPETVEASLQLSEALLADIGLPMGNVIASIHDRRAQMRKEIQTFAGHAGVPPVPRVRDRAKRKS